MNMQAMDRSELRLLRVFRILMTERSVSRAAERLGLSQPAMSHALQRLRVMFDDPLLLRSSKGMVPTERASQIIGVVDGLLADYDRLVSPQGLFDPALSQRRFVLTAPEYAEHLLLPLLFKHLREHAPGISVEVRTPDRDRGPMWLERGEVDLRIAWILKPPPSLRSTPLFQDRIVCIADRDHPTVHGALSLAQYLALPHIRLLGGGRTTAGQVIDGAIEKAGGGSRPMFLVQNVLTIPLMVVGTDMIATLPQALAARFRQQHPVQVLDVPLPLPRVRYAAYWHERSHRDAGHRWLRSAVALAAKGCIEAPMDPAGART
jgi:DNA-binding transcriptional LysR family regulator